jgi:hypothetical protein
MQESIQKHKEYVSAILLDDFYSETFKPYMCSPKSDLKVFFSDLDNVQL